MFIHYDEITNKVVGYTDFIDPIPEVWVLPTVEAVGFSFANPIEEYEIQNGVPVHVGKSAEQLAAEKAEKIKTIERAVQKHLDTEAQVSGYDNILSAASYAGYANPYQAEGQSFVAWRGDVWAYCYQVLADVEAGTRTEPTIDELIQELPQLTLPV